MLEANNNEGCTSSSTVEVMVDKGVTTNNDLDDFFIYGIRSR